MSRSDAHPVFSGKTPEGEPRKGHRHAFFLPVDTNGDKHIDHITVWAPEGFDSCAVRALQGLNKLWGGDGHPIRLILVGLGQAEEYRTAPSLSVATHWKSHTPFVLSRHPKRKRGEWTDTPEDQVRLACQRLLGVTPKVEHLPETRWSRFYRSRPGGGGSRASDRGYGFRLEFPAPIAGPIALGYGAHFGLGHFLPI
ncbi:MAG: type I-U CRISPR-associated protein Cas5/Cas6 [Proteobacteria bacterium]|nr:type I-U CRISPR-associated protein Cas5/Cas6 [Pseudomonadota bacterium]